MIPALCKSVLPWTVIALFNVVWYTILVQQ